MSKELAIKRGDSTLDKIRAHYADPRKFELSPAHEEIRLRLHTVLQLRLNYWSKQKIVTYLEKEYGIKAAQAYIDIRNSELLFGEMTKTDKKARQSILYEYAFQFLQKAREKADLKAEAKALELMSKFGGIDEDDIMEFNPEKFEAITPKLSVNKKALETFIKMAMQGAVNLNDFDATDIDFENIEHEEDGSE